ncbi:unnamed protein product [Brassica oleracea]|uniref:(rape) hypothetical protein n=1 Tax=Brassica napus TaxID=3708 RepID=A0A816QUI1_BRANA|nr:unnamed protein product [Brassica napus]
MAEGEERQATGHRNYEALLQRWQSGRSVRVGFAFPPTLIPPLPFAVVRTNSDITIEFKANACNEFSKFWEVDENSAFPEEPGVKINGNPREQNSQFKIEKVGEEDGTNIYRFTTSNGTVGAIPGPLFSPLLVLTKDVAKTIFVKFVKYNDATTTDVITSTSRVEKL